MTRYLITGADGMLGTELQSVLAGRDVRALGRAALDITDADAVSAAVRDVDVVVNAAAYTAVDRAEEHETEAYAVNATGPGNLAAAAAAHGARLVHVSTDYVFAGDAAAPYPEDAPITPVNAYGRTKAAGERLVAERHPAPHIVRTAWLYGAHGPNFVSTMLRLAGERKTVSVVTDQLGQPTWARDLARAIVSLLDAEAPAGVYHGTSSGETSWYGLAREAYALAGLDPDRVLPTTADAFPRPAPRPAYSVLGHGAWARAGLPAIRDWRDGLREAVPELLP